MKLPDDSIIEPDNDNIHAERYIPASNQSIDAAPIPASMQLYAASEMGPGLLLPNGQAAFFGGTGHVALYAPPSSGQGQGSWTAGPDIPSGRSASDDPAAMMVNGKILIAVGATSRDGAARRPGSMNTTTLAARTVLLQRPAVPEMQPSGHKPRLAPATTPFWLFPMAPSCRARARSVRTTLRVCPGLTAAGVGQALGGKYRAGFGRPISPERNPAERDLGRRRLWRRCPDEQ